MQVRESKILPDSDLCMRPDWDPGTWWRGCIVLWRFWTRLFFFRLAH